jgi:hypothetical protein
MFSTSGDPKEKPADAFDFTRGDDEALKSFTMVVTERYG